MANYLGGRVALYKAEASLAGHLDGAFGDSLGETAPTELRVNAQEAQLDALAGLRRFIDVVLIFELLQERPDDGVLGRHRMVVDVRLVLADGEVDGHRDDRIAAFVYNAHRKAFPQETQIQRTGCVVGPLVQPRADGQMLVREEMFVEMVQHLLVAIFLDDLNAIAVCHDCGQVSSATCSGNHWRRPTATESLRPDWTALLLGLHY